MKEPSKNNSLEDLRSENSKLRSENGVLRQRIAELEQTIHTYRHEHVDQVIVNERERILRTLIDFSYDWDYWVKPGEKFVYISPSCERITGYNVEAFLAQPDLLERVTHPDDRDKITHHIHEETSSACSFSLEFRIITRSGEERWIGHVCQPIYDSAGCYIGQRVSNRDITQQKQAEIALQTSRAQLQAIFDNAAVGICMIDQEERYVIVNDRWCDMLGYSHDSLNHMNYLDITHPDDRAKSRLKIQELLQGRIPNYRIEKRYNRKDGTVLWADVSVTPILNDDGICTCVVGVIVDIAQRKEFEESIAQHSIHLEQEITQRTSDLLYANDQLAVSEAHYRTLVETSPSAILLADLDGYIRFCNQQAAQLFGYSHVQALYGKRSTEIIAPEYGMTDPLLQVEQILQTPNRRNVEYMMYRQDGTRFPAEVSSSVVKDAEKNPVALTIVVHDIGVRKKAEEALKKANQHLIHLNQELQHNRNLLRAIFDGLDDGLLLLDTDETIHILNRTLEHWLGESFSEVIGSKWNALYAYLTKDDTESPNYMHFLSQIPKEQSDKNYHRIRYHHTDGSMRILDVYTIPILSDEQNTEYFIVQLVDVTERVLLQTRVIENERFAASGKLAATVAHEINTPLQALQTSLEMIQIATDEDRATFLTYALKEMKRLGQIVRQLLDLYRPTASQPSIVDVHTLIDRILLLAGKRFREQDVLIETVMPEELPSVVGRSDQLMQVFLNIMINALEAMPEGGVLHIGAREQAMGAQPVATNCDTSEWCTISKQKPLEAQTEVEIAITDTGNGISPELQQRIFEPFITSRKQGTGLGLSISNQIVQQHGGYIRVQSQPSKGSTFTIVLPAAQESVQGDASI